MEAQGKFKSMPDEVRYLGVVSRKVDRPVAAKSGSCG